MTILKISGNSLGLIIVNAVPLWLFEINVIECNAISLYNIPAIFSPSMVQYGTAGFFPLQRQLFWSSLMNEQNWQWCFCHTLSIKNNHCQVIGQIQWKRPGVKVFSFISAGCGPKAFCRNSIHVWPSVSGTRCACWFLNWCTYKICSYAFWLMLCAFLFGISKQLSFFCLYFSVTGRELHFAGQPWGGWSHLPAMWGKFDFCGGFLGRWSLS